MSSTYDFIVQKDEVGQWYAYPITNLGRLWYDEHSFEWDVSEQGIELSTTYDAFDSFLATMKAEGMRVIVDA